MFDFKDYYKKLNQVQKILFREKVMSVLHVDYITFYSWLTRNKISNKYLEDFNNKILPDLL